MGELRCTLKQAQDGVAVPLDELTTIIVVPAVAQVTLMGRAFDSGRTFLLPRAVNALNDVFAFAARMQAKHAVVVGHVDDVDPEPDVLSAARAKMAAAWLAGDPTPWVDQYADSVAEPQRWGPREDRYLLGIALGGAASPPPKEAESGDPQVRAFQTLARIKVDGIAGPVTRGKLVEKYFALSRAALLNGAKAPDNGITLLETEIVAHPAGVNSTLQQVADAKRSTEAVTESGGASAESTATHTAAKKNTASEAPPEPEPEPNARIDFMFFFAESGPEPAPGASDGPEFLEWVVQTELQRAMVVSPGSGGNTLFLELWNKAGTTRHKGAKYTLTGPETFTGVTDSQGRVEHDDVTPGDYTLTLTLEFFEETDKITDEHQCSVLEQNGENPPQVRLLGAVPRCELAQLKGLLFDTNKAFLVPEAVAALKDIRQIYEQHNGSELLVVGHTDTTGTPSVNDPLSWERAKATLAYLQDDVDTWLTFYETSMPAERRWGEAEDARMQELVGDPSLDRPGLIAAYMALDGVELDAAEFQMTGVAHGCGENFPLNDSGEELDEAPSDGKEDALDRRVELFFFDSEFGIVPKPKGEISKKGSKQYPAWRKLAKVVSEADVPGRGCSATQVVVGGAYFETNCSMFNPLLVVEDTTETGATAFSNDAFWAELEQTRPTFVERARKPDFETDEQATKGPIIRRGLEFIVAALRYAQRNPDRVLLVAGHTDRVGSEEDNERLSEARAQTIVALLKGDRVGFVTATAKYPSAASDGKLLEFAATSRAYPCRPLNNSAPSSSEIEAFQVGYNEDFGSKIRNDGIVGDETRGAYFDVLDAEIANLAGGLDMRDELRASLRFASPNREFVACGERFPIEAAQQDELASEPNRRVDLLFFTEQEAPDLSGAGLSEQIYEHGKLTRVVLDDLEAIEDQCLKEFRVEDAPPPEDGVGELEGSLTTEMQKLENERDPNDEHAYIEPFHDAFPEFLHQADGGVPEPITPSSS